MEGSTSPRTLPRVLTYPISISPFVQPTPALRVIETSGEARNLFFDVGEFVASIRGGTHLPSIAGAFASDSDNRTSSSAYMSRTKETVY